jgi:AcrR family transcriptional regulator
VPTTERRERRKLALRESILEAARSLIRDEGLRSVTMRRIADAIDYSPASLYAHFPSRDALLAELCQEGFAELRLALEQAAGDATEPRVRLRALASAYVRFALEHPQTYRLIFMEDPSLTKGVFESTDFDDGEKALALIVAPLVEMRASGELRREADPLVQADVLWTIVHGIASLRLSCPGLPVSPDATLIDAAIAAIVSE